jgi:transcriptional regulator with XRE-family HTH domain
MVEQNHSNEDVIAREKMKKENFLKIKKGIGNRFKQFREAIGKTQSQLADELGVYQSTITNIEVGKTFPSMKYLYYFHRIKGLNINWLVSSKGEIFLSEEEHSSLAASLLKCHVPKKDALYERYVELIFLMQIPEVEQIILAKLVELKVIAKDEIKQFFQKENEKLQNA